MRNSLPPEPIPVIPKRWLPRGEAIVEPAGRKPMVVWSGLPGERGLVRVVHEGPHLFQALWLESASPSPRRVTPVCERYTLCGGCPMMHVDAEGQADARKELVRFELQAEGLSLPVGDLVACPDGLQDYRHVVKLGVGLSDRGRIRVGAWGRRGRHIIPIPHCNVAAPVLRDVMRSLAHWIIELEIQPWDAETGRGVLRAIVLRASRKTGEVLVTLVAGRRVRALSDLAQEVGGGASGVTGVWLHINDGPGNAIFARDDGGVVGVQPLVGKASIDDELDGISYRIGPGDFFQTNPSTAELLYRRTIERLELRDGDPVVDLYCGVGGLTLQAARRTGWALGVEEIDGAIARARESARINRLSAEFLCGDVFEVLPDLVKRLAGHRPFITVNPPRSGLDESVIAGILGLKPRKVAYLSCNPKTLARDIVALQAGGLMAGEVELFDMFPNTAHVECLTVLTDPDAQHLPKKRAPRRTRVR